MAFGARSAIRYERRPQRPDPRTGLRRRGAFGSLYNRGSVESRRIERRGDAHPARLGGGDRVTSRTLSPGSTQSTLIVFNLDLANKRQRAAPSTPKRLSATPVRDRRPPASELFLEEKDGRIAAWPKAGSSSARERARRLSVEKKKISATRSTTSERSGRLTTASVPRLRAAA